MSEPSKEEHLEYLRRIIEKAVSKKKTIPDSTRNGDLHFEKTYGQLELPTQQVIDAEIYISEVSRILRGVFPNDQRTQTENQSALVNYLRDLYASDIQTTQPTYAHWHTDAQGIIKTALLLQQRLSVDDAAELEDLVNLLTNLPYPQQQSPHGTDSKILPPLG